MFCRERMALVSTLWQQGFVQISGNSAGLLLGIFISDGVGHSHAFAPLFSSMLKEVSIRGSTWWCL